ncbi:clavesin-1-like isoform X1 [Diabrotica virgifera virgifera]|uniref:CRAL-TRIO domain-containing protein n=1 Tax=Diabrotica virgifera virgifera TaxID=50390 RepID=A0ABM5KX73_DIAVI|nr:clavesin-1-like isoform X1 [Diabrotica virgifera virgifera]
MDSKHLLITDRKKIREAWGKSDEDVMQDIQIIRVWLGTQKHLPEIPTDAMIEFFLTNCKYSIEKTKQNLDMYYTARDLVPDVYRNINPTIPSQVEAAYATACLVILPNLTPNLHRVSIIRFRNDMLQKADINKFNANSLSNFYEVRIHEDLTMGDVTVIDYEHCSFSVMAKLSLVAMKQCVFVFEKVQSSRLKQLHLLNPPAFVDKILTLLKSFMKSKLKERIYIHKSIEDVYHYIPKDTLPSDYGGKEKSMAELEDIWKRKFLEYKDRFDYLDKITVNEALRPEKLKNDELLGYYGNFKKIQID